MPLLAYVEDEALEMVTEMTTAHLETALISEPVAHLLSFSRALDAAPEVCPHYFLQGLFIVQNHSQGLGEFALIVPVGRHVSLHLWELDLGQSGFNLLAQLQGSQILAASGLLDCLWSRSIVRPSPQELRSKVVGLYLCICLLYHFN